LPMGAQGSARAAVLFWPLGAGTNWVCAQAGDDISRQINSNFFIGMLLRTTNLIQPPSPVLPNI
jgi:hypothetical protein